MRRILMHIKCVYEAVNSSGSGHPLEHPHSNAIHVLSLYRPCEHELPLTKHTKHQHSEIVWFSC